MRESKNRSGDLLHRLSVILAFVFMAAAPERAEALVVKTWNGAGTPALINNTAPVDDPGWHNFGTNRSSIYLGNQWVLTATHVGVGRIDLVGGSYELVPGSAINLTNPTSFDGVSLNAASDLRMFRIKTEQTTGLTPEEQDPEVRTITIADRLPTSGDDLLLFGMGNIRTVNASDPDGQFQFGFNSGFGQVSSNQTRVWGNNRISSPTSITSIREGNRLRIDAGFHQIGYVTKFDDNALPDEAQGAAADSGGPVFFKDNGEWVLSGVMHAIYLANGQSPAQSWFGNHTGISDLSYEHYSTQVEGLRNSSLYSVLGDVDLDGEVTGEIVDGVATGDLGDLVDGWLLDQETPDVHSWQRGDLNQDGLTDLSDFVLLRDALGGSVSTASFATLVAALSVPEPSAVLLLAVGLAGFCGRTRRGGRIA